jgi:hypothetical protein
MTAPFSFFRILAWMAVLPLLLWAFGAVWFDFPWQGALMASGFLLVVVGAAYGCRHRWPGAVTALAAVLVVMLWWLQLKPSHDREWKPEVSVLPKAQIEGDDVVIEGVRDFDWTDPQQPLTRWITRRFRLSDITGMDIAINFWGSPWMAHPILIFSIEGQAPLAFSIETRPERGESFSALGGMYRMFELIILAGEERDLLGSRLARGEEIFLYRSTLSPSMARERLEDYLRAINEMKARPRWYHAITTNCTTAIRGVVHREPMPWDWRLLVNGFGDQMLFERGRLVHDGLDFPSLKAKARVELPRAEKMPEADDFSNAIRVGRPGFGLDQAMVIAGER